MSSSVVLLVFFLVIIVLIWFVKRTIRALRSVIPVSIRRGDMNQRDPSYIDELYTHCIVMTIIVLLFSYNNLTKELMHTVNCLTLSKTSSDLNPSSKFALIPSGALWVEDTNMTCFKGHHIWISTVGLLGLLVYSFGFIVFIFYILVFVGKVDNLQFRAKYGLLYEAYKPNAICWEIVILSRKAIIDSIVVFAYVLGPNLQAVLASGALVLALAAQTLFKPFKEFPDLDSAMGLHILHWTFPVDLNILETISLFLSFLTFYSGAVFNDDNTSEAGRMILMVIVVLFNTVFSVYLLVFQIGRGIKDAVDAKADSLSFDSSGSSNKFSRFVRKVVHIIRSSVNRSSWHAAV